MTRLPDPQLALQWRERLDRFDHAELTIAEFCELEGYSTASFYQWRRRLRNGELPVKPAFIPVDFDSVDVGNSDVCDRGLRGFEIDLPGGAIVKVPFDATTAERRELIAAIVQATSAEVKP